MTTFILFALFTVVCVAGSVPLDEGSSRIVNGENAQEGQFPWQGSLQYHQWNLIWLHICGASLIDANTVLTAAHCMISTNPASFRIRLGAHDFKNAKSHEQLVGVSSMALHPDWESEGNKGFPNDVAVVKLSSSANIANEFITPIEPYMGEESFAGHKCYITGWGKLSGTGRAADVLQVAHKSVISNTECRQRWSKYATGILHDFHICPFEENSSACSGDSGGPMSCYFEGKWYVVGITSWGMSSCDGAYPSVYTRVSAFKDFITNNI